MLFCKHLHKQKNELLGNIACLEAKNATINVEKDNICRERDSLKSQLLTYNNTKLTLDELKKEIEDLNKEILLENFNFSDYENLTSEECKNNVTMLKSEESAFVRSGNAVIAKYIPQTGEKKRYNNIIKQILRCFNSECDNALLNLSVKNIDTSRNKLQKSFDSLNKNFEIERVELSHKLLEFKLKELNLV